MYLTKIAPFRYRWIGTTLLVSLGMMSICAIILNATRNARDDIGNLDLFHTDLPILTILDLENQVIALQRDILRAQTALASDLDLLVDSFQAVSETTLKIRNNPDFSELLSDAAIDESLTSIESFLGIIATALYSDDEAFADQILTLNSPAALMLLRAQQLSASSIQSYTDLAVQQRDILARTWFDLGFIIVLLFWILLISVVVLLFSLRAGAARTAEISATKNRLNAMISTSIDGILVTDQDGRILDYNGAAHRVFGYAPHEAIGMNISTLIDLPECGSQEFGGLKQYHRLYGAHLKHRGCTQLTATRKGGRRFPVEISISEVESQEGQVFVSYLRDISEREDAREELVKARDQAVAGERAKANMLAVMSHEMRTPLNGLLGSLQLLARTKLNGRQRKFVDVMQTSGQLLLEHVNNVLDISRVDAGKVETKALTFDVANLTHDLATSFQAQAEMRGNKLNVKILGPNVGGVFGDRSRLSQVLVNLIGNALKFTENGQVSVEVERENGSDQVEFRVTDTGIGISEENQRKIFEDFVTLDTTFRREVEGTGLGLGIVKRLVHLLGGQIGVESEVNEGSVFWVRLPLPETSLEEGNFVNQFSKELPFGGISVLLIEDNEINRLVAREFLNAFGCQTTEAFDGQEGIDRASEEAFDLILCDISMPQVDGIQATKEIRAGSGPNKNTPIIALTAHALPDDIARFQSAGMTDVIVKPLTFDEIKRVTQQLTSKASSEDHQISTGLNAILGDEQATSLYSRANQEIGQGLDELAHLVAADAPPADIRASAHKLSGVAAVVGYSKLHSKLNAVESAALKGHQHNLSVLVSNARQYLSAP